MFLNDGAAGNGGGAMNLIAGWALIASGLAFLFLSKVKNMSDEDMQRALSVYAEQQKSGMKEGAKKFAKDHKEDAKKLAYDNKDVIAAVAYENKDVLAQAAFDNKEMLADEYLKNQNNKGYGGY